MSLTIIPTPAATAVRDRRPSERFCVRDCPTKNVSVESLLINSPVFVWSKNAISCLMIELKISPLNRLTIRCPKKYKEIFHY